MTFLFTDVEGSTRLWSADRWAMSASLSMHDTIVRTAVESAGGYVFATGGDSFAAAFGRASDAVAAARQAQAELATAAWPGPVLRVRMGIHLGEAEERGGDYFGPAVNTAARVGAAGHGGQVLLTETVRATAEIAAVDLGLHRLRDVVKPLHLFQLGDERFPPLRVADPALSNLPRPRTRIFGRDEEVSRVRELLVTNRLVTVTAVGGSGKTRLAIAVGEAELLQHPGGGWFVDLTALTGDAEVPAAIAKAVGLVLRDGDLVEQVVAYLHDKSALVILDNCEHVIEGCAQFADRLLTTEGRTRVLATSREALAIEGERTVVLGSLAADGLDAPAVRLFADRAGAIDPAFVVDQDNAPTVAAVCRHLDGMPLAIELAAARVTVMTPAELLVGLHDRFQLLAGGRYTTGAPRAVKHTAACQILLGQPAAAIETVRWLETFDVGAFTTEEIKALAHLALGNLAHAEALIRSHAERALTGRLTGEACDSALLLAALAHAEGRNDVAAELLLHMGMGLEPATVLYSGQLAARLGIGAEHAERQQRALTYDATSPEGPSGTRMAIAAVRRELARRGWD